MCITPEDLARDRAGPKRPGEVLGGDLLLVDVLLEDDLIEARQHVDEVVPSSLGRVGEVGRDVERVELLAHAFIPDQSLHGHDVDDPAAVSYTHLTLPTIL